MSSIDWKKEAERLKDPEDMEKLDWWQATPGKHKIKVLKEGGEYIARLEDKEIKKVRLEVEVNNKRFNWGITCGMTEQSLWGQLCLLGSNLGSLEGQEITLLVKGSGKNRDYTIEEALPYMKVMEEKVK